MEYWQVQVRLKGEKGWTRLAIGADGDLRTTQREDRGLRFGDRDSALGALRLLDRYGIGGAVVEQSKVTAVEGS